MHSNKAIEDQEENFNYFFNEGSQKDQNGDYSSAVFCYTKALQYKADWLTYYSRGMAYYRNDNNPQAISDFTEALKYEKNSLIYCSRGMAYSELGLLNVVMGIDDYYEAIKIDPNCVLAYQKLGDFYFENNDFSQALLNYNKLISLTPNDPNAYTRRGNAYSSLKMTQLAISNYLHALELNNNHLTSLHNLGNVYFSIGKFQDAIVYYKKAIKINRNCKTFYNCGNAFNALGDYEQAIFYFKCALNLDSTYAAAYCGWGNSCYLQNNISDAIDLYYKTIEIDPHYRTVYDELIKVFKSDKLDTISKSELFNIIKIFPIEIVSVMKNNQVIPILIDACLDSRTVLGQRFWKQEGFEPCHLEEGTLKDIYEYAKTIYPQFKINVKEYSPKKPIAKMTGSLEKNSLFKKKKLDELDQISCVRDMHNHL